jgi:hypothetical protein
MASDTQYKWGVVLVACMAIFIIVLDNKKEMGHLQVKLEFNNCDTL